MQPAQRVRGKGGALLPPSLTVPPHFHFEDGRCMFVWMAFDIFFIFIFQRNGTEPMVVRKDQLQHPGPGMGSQ